MVFDTPAPNIRNEPLRDRYQYLVDNLPHGMLPFCNIMLMYLGHQYLSLAPYYHLPTVSTTEQARQFVQDVASYQQILYNH